MLNRKLGNTGIAVSKIALGTMYFGSETPEAEVSKSSTRTLRPAEI
jgi:aryl-alcohol dehydrogenase-like predicted oxidoreductase